MSNAESLKPVVLVVEDETLIRMDAMEMIRDSGYEVAEAAEVPRRGRPSQDG